MSFPLPKMALAMIAKDEAAVIGRALASVLPLIAGWVVVDTGSTDDTALIAQRILGHLPGAVFKRDWVNFSHNRNDALDLAFRVCDYAIVLDADDVFVIDEARLGASMENAPAYWVDVRVRGAPGIVSRKIHVVHKDSGYRYAGSTHETLYPTENDPLASIHGLLYDTVNDGHANRTQTKFARDAALLESEVKANPANLRSLYYLAQTYRDMGRLAEALVHYEARGRRGGWPEEQWRARFEAAMLLDRLTVGDDSIVVNGYLFAYELLPSRAEPLHALAVALRARARWSLALLFARMAAAMPEPPSDHIMAVDRSVYLWRARDEVAVALTWLGRHSEALPIMRETLARTDLPPADRERIEANVRKSEAHL